jgi:hypothetical protein
MRRWLAGAAFLVAASLGAGSGGAQEAGVTGVIRGQIDAFLADDFARAFTFASPAIRGIFGTPENFGMMVRQGYPMVWRPAEVTFGPAEPRGAAIYQQVFVTDQAGRLHVLLYEMIPAGDGWQINGVQILRAPQVGA